MRMELSAFHNLDVYTTKGKFVGRVDDVVLDPNDKRILGIAVGNVNRDLFDVDARGVIIPYRWITAVADIVIMRQVESKKVSPAAAEEKKKR
ncbi:MAG: PRC-barrel domain-containing protein [Euryarchaeota archaeon]|nr:PRC-barrel domain-containing protein [Euryarchaeota archaeon]